MEIDVHNTYKIFVHISYIKKCTCIENTIIMNKEIVYIKFMQHKILLNKKCCSNLFNI